MIGIQVAHHDIHRFPGRDSNGSSLQVPYTLGGYSIVIYNLVDQYSCSAFFC